MAVSTNALGLYLVAYLVFNAVAFEPTPTTDSLAEGDSVQQRGQSAEFRMLSHGSAVEASHGASHGPSPTLAHGAHTTSIVGGHLPAKANVSNGEEHGGDHGDDETHADFDIPRGVPRHCLTKSGDFTEHKGQNQTENSTRNSCTPEDHAQIIHSLMPTIFFAAAIQMFLIGSLFLLTVTKWKDADVRRSVYIMISTTVSIFIAILINKTVFDVWFLQILPCPRLPTGMHIRDDRHHAFPGELCGRAPPMAMFVVCIAFYFIYLFSTQCLVICSRPRGRWKCLTKTGYVASILGAHLKGFAAVGAFGVLQYEKTHAVPTALLVVLLAACFFLVTRMITWFCCCGYFLHEQDEESREKGEEDDSYSSCSIAETQDLDTIDAKEDEAWVEMLSESNDEAAALCLGFLLVQTLCLGVIGFVPPVENEEFHIITEDQRNTFIWWEYMLIIAFAVIVIVRWLARHARIVAIPFTLKLTQCVIGMTLSWLFFRHCDWFYRQLLNDIFNPAVPNQPRLKPPHAVHLAARLVNALQWSVISVILVILFDVAADGWHAKDFGGAIKKFCSALNPGFPCCSRPLPVSDTFIAIDEFKQKEYQEEHDSDFENPFRDVIGTLGFLVGVCWEKAFSEANLMLGESFFELTHHVNKVTFEVEHRTLGPLVYMWHDHPMVTKCFFASVVVLFVFVIWVKYLVPYAKLHEAEHTYLYYTEGFVIEKMNARVTKAEAEERQHRDKYDLMLALLQMQAQYAGWRCQQCQGRLQPQPDCQDCEDVKDAATEITKQIGQNLRKDSDRDS